MFSLNYITEIIKCVIVFQTITHFILNNSIFYTETDQKRGHAIAKPGTK